MHADFGLHSTNVEELYSYDLATAYYGWHYQPSPACEYIYSTSIC